MCTSKEGLFVGVEIHKCNVGMGMLLKKKHGQHLELLLNIFLAVIKVLITELDFLFSHPKILMLLSKE
jgi:hypothetical protein